MKAFFSPRSLALLAGLAIGWTLTGPPTARAQVAATLQNFATFGKDDFSTRPGPLLRGSDGYFYGVTQSGGDYEYGTVFKTTPTGQTTTLYSFGSTANGIEPFGRLVQGSDGSLYGVTAGSYESAGSYMGTPLWMQVDIDGTIFRLAPTGELTTLHRFHDQTADSLVRGSDGNFYGVVHSAFSLSEPQGTVFRMTPTGEWTDLYTFTSSNSSGSPGGLVQGSDGNFYGTTSASAILNLTLGGTVVIPGDNGFTTPGDYTVGTPGTSTNTGGGTVFRLTPTGVLTTLCTFSGNGDGGSPTGALVQGVDGNFYGTTYSTVFRLTPAGELTTLHRFTGRDGSAVQAGLALGADGNFYGATAAGGDGYDPASSTTTGHGTLFQITPAGVLTTLYNFDGEDGTKPNAPLLPAGGGLFYGTTTGTAKDEGTIAGGLFALKVSPQPAFFTGQTALTKGVYYLALPGGEDFGFYTFLSDPRFLYHYDLGYEYVFDAADGHAGVYLYDFASQTFFYTSPAYPFPYLYDFTLNTVLYYYPDPEHPGRYNTDGTRYFYRFDTGQIISK